jgi:hypothetical protein
MSVWGEDVVDPLSTDSLRSSIDFQSDEESTGNEETAQELEGPFQFRCEAEGMRGDNGIVGVWWEPRLF